MHHATTSILFGLLFLGLYGWLWKAPESFRTAMMAYPRKLWVGVVLAGISLAWFGYNISSVDFGPFAPAKKVLFGALPVFLWLMWRYIPDLLAVRGLGYIILLAGNPILVQVRWHGTPAHYAVAVVIYVLVIKSCFLIIYPNWWKRGIDRLYSKDGLPAKAGLTGMGLGALLVLCGVLSF